MIQCHGKVFIGFTLHNLNYVLKYNWIHSIHTVHSTMFSLKKLRPLEDSNCLDWSSKKNYFYQATQTLDINFKQKISNLLRLTVQYINSVFINYRSLLSVLFDTYFSFQQHYLPQSCDDGYLEIIGLTSKSMVSFVCGCVLTL